MLARISFLTLTLLMAHHAQASDLFIKSDVFGNGGDAVVCPTSVEMLDLYEGRTIRNIRPDPTLVGADVAETVNNILNRLETIDPFRARNYKNWASTFMAEAAFVPDADLVDVPDSKHLAIPTGCTVEQIVVQQYPQYPQDPRYIISQKLWYRLDTANRAALIMHEIVYREALEYEHKNSIAARYINSLINSLGFNNSLYIRAMEAVNFPAGTWLTTRLWNGKRIYFGLYASDRLSPKSCGQEHLMREMLDDLHTNSDEDSPYYFNNLYSLNTELRSFFPDYYSGITVKVKNLFYRINKGKTEWELWQYENNPSTYNLLCVER